MSDKNVYEWGIETIETVSKIYRVKFEFIYGSNRKAYADEDAGIWRIRVMDKLFKNKDFITCAQQAVAFVYNAHENQPK